MKGNYGPTPCLKGIKDAFSERYGLVRTVGRDAFVSVRYFAPHECLALVGLADGERRGNCFLLYLFQESCSIN